jgi:uncharacterized protein
LSDLQIAFFLKFEMYSLKLCVKLLGKYTRKIMKKLYSLILLTQRISGRFPRVVISLFLIGTVIFLFGLPRLQFLLSVDDLVDSDFKIYEGLKTTQLEFHDRNTVMLSIESPTPFSKKYLCDVQGWILKMSEDFGNEISLIQSSFGIRQVLIENSRLTMNSPIEVNCQNTDPEIEKIKAGFEQIKKSPWLGLLHTFDNYALTINFVVSPPLDQHFGNFNVRITDQIRAAYDQTFSQNQYKVFYSGVTTYQNFLKKAMDQTQMLNILMLILSLFVFKYFLGSWKAGLIFNLTVILSISWMYGFMGFFNLPIDVLSNSIGLILFVSCLEDFVFITYGIRKFGWSLQKSLRRFLLPSFFTSLTTAIGFASLMTSDLGIIRRTGGLVAAGAIVEWAMIFLVLPAILKTSWRKYFYFRPSDKKLFSFDKITAFAINKTTAWVLTVVIFISAFFASTLKVKDSPEAFFYDQHEINQTSRHLKKTRGWTNENSLLFSADNSDAENVSILDQIKAHPIVANIESKYTMEKYLTSNLKKSEQTAVSELWRNSSFSKRLVSINSVQRAQVYLNSMDNDVIENFIRFVDTICSGRCQIVGTIISYSEFSNRILKTLFNSFFTSLILVCFVIFSIRSPLSVKETFYCVVSSLWGPMALIAVFVWFKIPVFFISSICASVMVGLAGDNAIQFIFSAKKRNLSSSVNSLAQASLITTIGNCLMLCIFFFSPIAPLAKLGGLMMVGILFCYIGDLYILKGYLKKN